MAKTLHIHIGHYKTGTTAVQAFMARNRDALLDRGLDYCSLGLVMDKHNVFATPLLYGRHRHLYVLGHDNPARPREFWDKLYEYVAASPAEHVLISSEEFIRVGEHDSCSEYLERVARRSGDAIDLRAICYLRPPGSHLESWYNQLVKLNRGIGHRARSIALEFDRINVDYGRALRPWAEILGPEKLFVRQYRSDWRASDALYRDFLSLFPIEIPEQLELPEGDPNPRIDDRTLELVRVLNRLGLPEDELQDQLDRFTAYLEANPPEEIVTEDEFEKSRRAALSGLDFVGELPNSNVDVRAFKADPPRIRPEWEDFSAVVLEYALSRVLARDDA